MARRDNLSSEQVLRILNNNIKQENNEFNYEIIDFCILFKDE